MFSLLLGYIFSQTSSKIGVFQPPNMHSRFSTSCIFIATCTFILREFVGIVDHIQGMLSQIIPCNKLLDD